MRYPSIDFLRTYAIFLMVLVHFAENLSGVQSSAWNPTGFGAPVFSFLMGMSYHIWLSSQEAKGRSDEQISKTTIRRGLFLLALGFAFNILVWLPEDTYNWDVLTFIGAAIVFLNVARRMPSVVLVVICVLVFVISPLTRAMADYPSYWVSGYFECDLTLSQVLLGFSVTGFFPLLPWIIYPLTGMMTARYVFSADNKAPTTRPAIIGGTLIAAGVLCLILRTHAPAAVQKHLLLGWKMFPATVEYVLCTLGFALLAFALTHRWIDLNPAFPRKGRAAAIAGTFSRHSLSIYILHHVVHLWPLWIYGVAKGQEATYYWGKALPIQLSIALSVVFIIAAYFLFRWMDRTGRGGVEKWMRWICD